MTPDWTPPKTRVEEMSAAPFTVARIVEVQCWAGTQVFGSR